MPHRTVLPDTWRSDYTLQDIIPASVDWCSFARIPYARRYAASITGEGVFDLKRRTFVHPRIDKRNGRKRFRLNCDDKAAGKRATVKTPYYASIICTLVEGARASRSTQCHHVDHDRTRDHWTNVTWASRKANQRMAVEHHDRKGSANPNAKLTSAQLANLLDVYDTVMRGHERPDVKGYADFFKITVDQVRRLVAERSRTEEVRTIRTTQRQEREKEERRQREGFESLFSGRAWSAD